MSWLRRKVIFKKNLVQTETWKYFSRSLQLRRLFETFTRQGPGYQGPGYQGPGYFFHDQDSNPDQPHEIWSRVSCNRSVKAEKMDHLLKLKFTWRPDTFFSRKSFLNIWIKKKPKKTRSFAKRWNNFSYLGSGRSDNCKLTFLVRTVSGENLKNSI